MPINTLATATLFQTTLDKLAEQELLTGWMDANSGQVIYNGGADVKIPIMNVAGLGDYDRDSGYPQGAVSLRYQTHTMTQDRGRKFQLDAMDVDENNFVTTGASVMGEFQRTGVIPEIDAYRLSKAATIAITKADAKLLKYSYTPAEGTILKEIKTGIKAIRAKGYSGQLMIHITPDAMLELEMALAGKIQNTTFSVGGVDTTVPAVDGVPLIETPDNRMTTAITTNAGTNKDQGGFTASGLQMNFIILGKTTPIAVTKQDKMKIFTPDQNQDADAWKMNYRRFHELWVLENQATTIYVNIKNAKPAG